MKIAIVVPWRDSGDKLRARNWIWVKKRWGYYFPNYDIIEADCKSTEWNKPAALNAAIMNISHDVLIIADADCFIASRAIQQALSDVTDDNWIVPHLMVHRLSKDVTQTLTESVDIVDTPAAGATIMRPYLGRAGGGLLIIGRKNYWRAGGFDERFRMWGAEDSAFGIAADTLVGNHIRYEYPLVHMYHSPGRRELNPYYRANKIRVQRYKQIAKRGNKAALAELVAGNTQKMNRSKHPFYGNVGTISP